MILIDFYTNKNIRKVIHFFHKERNIFFDKFFDQSERSSI